MTNLHSSQIRSLAEAANNITNPITEAPKAQTSSKEQEWANTHANLMREWFSHMSNQNVVDIFKIIKTKDYSAANMKKLKTYLMDAGITDRMGMVRPAKYQKPLDDIGALRSDETAVAIIKAGWAYFADRARPAAEAIAANKTASKAKPKSKTVEEVETTVEEVETVEEAVKIDRNMNIKEMAAVLMDIADALMGKNVVTQRERLKAITQVLASKRGFV